MTFQRKKVLGILSAAAMSVSIMGTAFADGPSVGGFVDFGYNYNFNRQTTNVLRGFDTNSNTFTLQDAKVAVSGTTKDNVSYKVDVIYGYDATLTHSAGFITQPAPSSGTLTTGGNMQADVEQAYVSFPCPLTNGTVTVGKFATPFGAEVIEANGNMNISRGFLFNYAIPFTHTGIKYDKTFGSLSLTAGLVNGWDNMTDNNKGKTVLAQLGYQVTSKIKATLGGAYGPEQATALPSKEKNGRSLIDAIVTFAPTDKISLLVNADWGVEKVLTAVSATNSTQNWQGVAIAGSYAFNDKCSAALRFENLADEGSRTGTNQSLDSITATLQHKMNGVIYRLEFRGDNSNKKVFTDNSGIAANSKKQSTVGAQIIYAF